MNKKKLRIKMPLHPFFVGCYMVINLFSKNITEVPVTVIWRPLVILLFFTITFYFLLYLFTKSWQVAGLILSIFIVLFFSYGHFYSLTKNISIGGMTVFRHRVLLPIWLLISMGYVFFILKRLDLVPTANRLANLIALLLITFPVTSIGVFEIKQTFYASRLANQNEIITLDVERAKPDIYYIVLDSYTRQNVLQNVFNFDNTEFISGLEDLGFYVAGCSQSNYGHTKLSLTSTLNMEYSHIRLLQDVPKRDFNFWLEPNFKHSQVRTFLEQQGYFTVSFSSGFPWGEWKDADYFYPVIDTDPCSVIRIEPFEDLLIDTTLTRIVNGVRPDWKNQFLRKIRGVCEIVSSTGRSTPESIIDSPQQLRRERTLFVLETLSEIPKIPGPKFVFVHLILPHPPYVFGPNGEPIDLETGVDLDDPSVVDEMNLFGYRSQVQYANKRMLEILPIIIENSSSPPVIILQGDHGSVRDGSVMDKMAILNVYYLPQSEYVELYASISPVNSFRVVFNEYFNTSFSLLPDISYYAPTTGNFNYMIVPNDCEVSK
jgi:hypothetical protein